MVDGLSEEDLNRLHVNNWEVRTGHTTLTWEKECNTEQFKYVVCEVSLPQINYIRVSNWTSFISLSYNQGEIEIDGKVFGWGSSAEEAVVRAFEYER